MGARFMSRGIVVALLVAWGAPARAQKLPLGDYTVRDFGVVSWLAGSRLNSAGSWAASCRQSGGTIQLCGYYNQGIPPNNLYYGAPSGSYFASEGRGINAAGFSVGQTTTAAGWIAALWSGPVLVRALPPFAWYGASRARDINDYGLSVGLSTGDGTRMATYWTSAGVANTLTTTWPDRARLRTDSEAAAINNRNTTGGFYIAQGQTNSTAWVMLAGGGFNDAIAGNFRTSEVTDLNDNDAAVGSGITASGQTRGWGRLAGGGLIELPPLAGATGTGAFGINNGAVAVGFSSGSSDGTHAVSWPLNTPGAPPTDLQTRLGLTLNAYRLTTAVAINDAGQILCEGFIAPGRFTPGDPPGTFRAILLTPR